MSKRSPTCSSSHKHVSVCLPVCVFSLFAILALTLYRLSHSLNVPTGTFRFSLGVAQIWQRLGLHPMQETHPSEATCWPSVCVCVRVWARFMPTSALYKQDTYSHLQDLIVYTIILQSDGSDRLPGTFIMHSRRTLLLIPPELFFSHYTHIAFIPTLSFLLILLHSVSAAGVPTYSATKCCHAGFSLRFVRWKLLLPLFLAILAMRK